MKLKGELDSIGVAELFKTLADQRATGILVVNSPMGEKTIALSLGEIAICADNLTERTRLGELLVARSKLTEEQLQHALKAQRLDARSKLGDVLVKQGLCTPELIVEAIRFQVEEQITDLFTWKEASFEFDSEKSLDDVYDPDGGGNALQRLSISTLPLMADIGKRMEGWKAVQERIPTPYLCFKVTPKGEELVSKAPKNTQVIVKLLKEGRTLETTIKKCCMGRINVCNTVVKLIEDAWLFPVPGNELRFLASEHRFKKRFLDALYIYRRLRDIAQTDADRGELDKHIRDTIDAIEVAAASGESSEGSEIVSYKEAAERYRRRQRIRRIALGVFVLASVVVIVFLLLKELAPKGTLPEDYTNMIKKSDALVEQHKYGEARALWKDFRQKMPEKSGDTFNSVNERELQIYKQEKSYVDSMNNQARMAELKNPDEAEKLYKKIIEAFSTDATQITEEAGYAKDAEQGLARIKQNRETAAINKTLDDMKARRQAALDLFKKKDYTAARKSLTEVDGFLPPGSELRAEVEDDLRVIQEIEDRARRLMETARQQIANKQGETARDTLLEVYKQWSDVPGAAEARAKRNDLQMRLDQLNAEKKRGEAAEAEDNVVPALEILRGAEHDYPEFELVNEVHKHVETLTAKLAEIDKALADAQDALKAGDKQRAKLLFSDLIQNQFAYLVVKNVKIPILVSSTPAGAVVTLDGKEVGHTPCEVLLPVGGPSTVVLELSGYEPATRKFTRLVTEDLNGYQTTLRRGALSSVKFDGGIYAPPRVIDGVLYVFHGNALSILDPECKQKPPYKTVKDLFDVNADTRPSSSGDAQPTRVADKTWWLPRTAPEPYTKGKVLLLLRSRDVLSLDTATMEKPEKLITLPTEPIGAPFFDGDSLLGGAPLLSVGCADGKIYITNLKTKEPIQGSPVQSDSRPEIGKSASLAAGLSGRSGKRFVSLSSTGYMACFTSHDGKEQWNLDLKGVPAADNVMPDLDENLAAIVMRDGRLVVVDLNEHRIVWQLTPIPGEEVVRALVTRDGVFVLNRKSGRVEVRKFERLAEGGQPRSAPGSGSHSLDSDSDLPLVAGKALFICTNTGTIYAQSLTTLEHVWTYQTNKGAPPSQMSVNGDLLYLAFPTGDLMVLSGK